MSQKKTQTQVEDALQKETQARVEDILLRPDKYIGSIEKHKQYMWVYENDGLVYKPISYVHGLYRIFDEILINAAHNKMRDLGKEKNKMRDPLMDSLQVTIDREKNTVSVYNNGLGVSVKGVRRGEETLYLPDLLFGHLRNSNDNVRRRDKGYGAKLTNIFSNRFVIETADGQRKRTFRRLYINNMGKKYKATIGSCKENDNWTKVTFVPDLEKFKMTYLEEDVVALMKKRVLDMAGCLGLSVKVELDGTCLYIKSFKEYVDLYLKSAGLSPLQRAHAKVDDRCEICVSPSNGKFQQVSFVNCIATNKGGTHVDYITNQITTFVMKEVKEKQKNVNVHAQDVKNQLWIFVNAFIDKPVFDSQTKETLTTGHASFGFKCDVPKSVLKDVANSGIVEKLLSLANTKLSDDLKKTDGTKARKIHGMGTRLVDAEEAG